MQIATGTVINGKVVLEGVALVEGAIVTIVSRGADETFSLSPEQESDLAMSLEEIDQGHFVSLDTLLGSLPSPN
ncbi:MAG TPA: hypothetical protein VET87_10915 [Rubrivivax sp.]|jgi:hypothetical protein|nr:hypothetical protein [Rubrivivax sp.]